MMTPQPQAIAAFNAFARAQKWPVACDPTLSFEALELEAVLDVWRSLCTDGSIPRRDQIKPHLFKAQLGNIAIIERVQQEPSRYFVRLMGSRLSLRLGEMQGKMLDESLEPEIYRRWAADAELVLSEQCPLRFFGDRMDHRQMTYLRAESLVAPLTGPSGTPSCLLVAMVIRSSNGRPN
jgi:hypothetical protein